LKTMIDIQQEDEMKTGDVLGYNARRFADACYTNSLDELRAAVTEAPDLVDCREWSITPDEWRAAIETALRERIAIVQTARN